MAIFEDGFKSCEDFDNNFVDCTGLVLDTASASEACIEGAVDLFKAVDNQKVKYLLVFLHLLIYISI